MTVYKPEEINVQELLQKQHEKYGKKMIRNYERKIVINSMKEKGYSMKSKRMKDALKKLA